MKVMWITNLPAPYRYPVWRELAQRIDLTVLYLRRSEAGREWVPEDHPAFEQHYIGELGRRRALGLVRGADAVVLAMWEHPFALAAARVASLAGGRTIGFYESTSLSHRFRSGPVAWVRGMHFRRLDALVVVSEGAADAVQAMGVNPDAVHVSFNPVDHEWWHRAIEDRRHSPARGHHFAYVGQLIRRKNIGSLIEAFERVAGPDDRLAIVGDGPLCAELTARVARSPRAAQADVRVALPPEGIAHVLGEAHTLVLPSEEEVWGMVVNEALAGGLHTVVSDRCGVARSPIASMDGVYLSRPDAGSLAAAMRLSRDDWDGPIIEPAILAHGPATLAGAVLDALGVEA